MLCRRKLKEGFQPIFDKENNDSQNCQQVELEKTNHSKRFTLKISSAKDETKDEHRASHSIVGKEIKEERSCNFCFQTFKKPSKSNDLPPTQCPHELSTKNPQTPSSLQKFNIQPRFLDFSNDSPSPLSQWTYKIIEIPPYDDFDQDIFQQAEQIQNWHRKFQEYDMNSDIENMPPSDGQDESQSESDNQSEQSQNVNLIMQSGKKKGQRFSLSPKLTNELSEIYEVDETTNTNVSRFELRHQKVVSDDKKITEQRHE